MSILHFRRKGIESSSVSSSSTVTPTDDSADFSKGPLGLNVIHCPLEPRVDFVFVHGLGDGSRKTWSRSKSITHFWPQEWLPKDPAFSHVRVHSFGYDSNWTSSKENCLNIHHFGKLLLAELDTSPMLSNCKTPIVFIGHSMGGLVIKKAVILAKQGTGYETLLLRFSAIYFLATPHRGTNTARVLNNIIQLAHLSREYVTDLQRGSAAVHVINEEFRHCTADIEIWSFYETQKLKMGVTNTLIVDPESAILGYPKEQQVPMSADHRSICKFETQTDPNYVIIRNALATTVQAISQRECDTRKTLHPGEIDNLEKFLGVSEAPEDDLTNVDDARLSGTCQWIFEKEDFQTWTHFTSPSPKVVWLTGRPAAGKSVLAGYVIRRLQELDADCSYYFFKHGDRVKARLNRCLRSLAFQMASANAQVRDAFRDMQRHGINIDSDNERTIWRKIFVDGIFKAQLRKQYWVIDALDECTDGALFFGSMFETLQEALPLRICITSRYTPEIQKQILCCGDHRYLHQDISTTDTFSDIRLLVEARSKAFSVDHGEHRDSLVQRVLSRSEGSFLWTKLVLSRLFNSYGEREINQALDGRPGDMEPLYQRILDMMTRATGGRTLAKALLTWTTCATRPLTIKELRSALEFDVDDNFSRLEESIIAVCGHLVTIDRFSKVQMLHETAREFLLDDSLESEFAIKGTEAHTRIARTCLTYLTGEKMKPPRTSRRGSASKAAAERPEFTSYACNEFSYHLSKANPLANDLLSLTDKFLTLNVLSWIEYVARTRDLLSLIRAGKNLKKYLHSCDTARSPLGTSMQTLRDWTTELGRIVAKFADALILSPSSIHTLIPPFCPRESVIRRIGGPTRRLSVVGLSNVRWEDRLTCIDCRDTQISAVAFGDDFFAVGWGTGS